MSKLTKKTIRKLIMQEIAKMVDEDRLLDPPDLGEPHYLDYIDQGYDSCPTCDNIHPGKKCPSAMNEPCPTCNGMHPGEKCPDKMGAPCPSCGKYHKQGQVQAPGGYLPNMLDEGCGCGGSPDKGEDYSLDSMGMQGVRGSMIDNLFSAGAKNVDIDWNKEDDHSNNYMAKPQLHKISKYAQKLYQMLPDGYELDDWMRSHLAGIADDMSEVFHALEHDFSEDEF